MSSMENLIMRDTKTPSIENKPMPLEVKKRIQKKKRIERHEFMKSYYDLGYGGTKQNKKKRR